jgi:IclR family pca regulon transcriptional regulator
LVRERGHAMLDEELEMGLISLAVPIRDRTGAIVASVNVSTQAARVTASEAERRMLPPLREAQRHIETFLAIT